MFHVKRIPPSAGELSGRVIQHHPTHGTSQRSAHSTSPRASQPVLHFAGPPSCGERRSRRARPLAAFRQSCCRTVLRVWNTVHGDAALICHPVRQIEIGHAATTTNSLRARVAGRPATVVRPSGEAAPTSSGRPATTPAPVQDAVHARSERPPGDNCRGRQPDADGTGSRHRGTMIHRPLLHAITGPQPPARAHGSPAEGRVPTMPASRPLPMPHCRTGVAFAPDAVHRRGNRVR